MTEDLIRKKDAVSRISDLLIIELQGKRLPTWNEIYHAIDDIPSAVPERKKGKWRHLGGDEWCCTNCGYVVSTEGAWENPKEQGKDYCEHCGSDMRSEYE